MFERLSFITDEFKKIQQETCTQLESWDDCLFSKDQWTKKIGTGTTRVLSGGNVIEKGAVNFSHVQGKYTEQMAQAAGMKGSLFAATGISSIIHPVNPFVPIIHYNIRYFELDNGKAWFGGGMDLTPHYVDIEQAQWFHQQVKDICDTYNSDFYPRFKKEADDYYYLSHRDETRGIGGIIFDRLDAREEDDFQALFKFCLDLGKNYALIYNHLIELNKDRPFGKNEKEWQNMRRGRYVEFNLIHDRGTKFGLVSGGNTESILVSMPPLASWQYDFQPLEASNEQKTLNMLKREIDWINA